MLGFSKKISVAIVVLLCSSTESVRAASGKYDYLFNGADWPLSKESGSECHLSNQSPIDLRTDMHSEPFPKADGSEFKPTWADFQKATVLNKGMVIQVDVPSDAPKLFFESQHAVDVIQGNKKFNAAQFHFHAKSEHTINGRRFDLEMHTVHLAEESKENDDGIPIFASAVGIIFDRKNYDPTITPADRVVIDKFFDAMNFGSSSTAVDDKGNKKLAENVDVNYGELTKIINFGNRWAYSGSLTTPPCTRGVYFQVAERVLPISNKHYQQYLDRQREHTSSFYRGGDGSEQTAAVSGTPAPTTLDKLGNWRITQKIDNHNVRFMRSGFKSEEESDPKTTTMVLAILLGISLLIAIILGVCACRLMRSEKTAAATHEEQSVKEGGESDYAGSAFNFANKN